jgi:UDP-N-acetylmuramoyl-tripeptide--D-alanyl-D-alanine ligase
LSYIYRMTIEALYQIYLSYPNVQTDTRKLKTGDIYFALKGENFNGNQFAQQAIKQGAAYAIIDEVQHQYNEQCILVNDVLKTLQALAAYHRQQFDIPFIAITGSNGKTTTKELILAVLSSTYKTYATEGNLNNHIGVPLTILKIRQDAQMVIIEMGANHQKEIESYCLIAKPTHALINNCGKAHLEGFGGIEGVRKGKGELYDFIRATKGIVFRNTDLDYLAQMSAGIEHQILYGEHESMYRGRAMMEDGFLRVAILQSQQECLIKTQLVGDYNFSNVMAAIAIGRTFSISMSVIKQSIEAYAPSNSRSQLVLYGSNKIILDAYNANPSSVQLAIKNFAVSDYPNKVIMLGAMKELGNESIEEHQQIIEQLKQTNWNEVVLVGGDFEKVKHPFIYFEDAFAAKNWFIEKRFEQTAVLIKGSRAFTMEKIIED